MALARLLALTILAASTARAHHPPAAEVPTIFVDGVAGPEGLAFARDGRLIVGTTTGQLLRFAPDGSRTVLADVGEALAGITVLRNKHILAASFGAGRVWSVHPKTGAASVFASDIPGANFIVETRRGRILVSASTAGTIFDITDGTPVPRATGLAFPNGLAIGRDGFLYVAETFNNRIRRLLLSGDGTLGPPEPYATGTSLADGIAFDRAGNLLVVGLDSVRVVAVGSATGAFLSNDPLLDWPSNLAFGRGRGFKRKDVYLVNFGQLFGNGTTIVRFRYNHQRSPLIR
jgi:sugar lactone lactonase YvrE